MSSSVWQAAHEKGHRGEQRLGEWLRARALKSDFLGWSCDVARAPSVSDAICKMGG